MLRLTQLELLGFKSFPHKTLMELDGGVTCIVGPNGSGKSNLSDAINFAFGSQSGKELRAHNLSGLIFAGTEQLRPLNIASVTLHFEVIDDTPPEDEDAELLEALAESGIGEDGPRTAQVDIESSGYPGLQLTVFHSARLEEKQDRTPGIIRLLRDIKTGDRISLTRRIFRDGTGGYFINDEQVRLKDVDELFNRFNLGRNSVYSVSQGEVEKKILGTPQEMREWLAEATGVALLLQQKNRAQQKLKKTSQNLERLEDIRTNTRQLVEDLADQRVKAEEHLRVREQLRIVELNEIKREVEFSQRQQLNAESGLEELENKLVSSKTALDDAKLALGENDKAREEARQELESCNRRLESQREQAAQLRQAAAVARQAVSSHEQAIERARHDSDELKNQLTEMDAHEEAIRRSISQAREEQAAVADGGGETSRRLRECQEQVNELSQQQTRLSSSAFENAQQLARINNQLESIERSERQLSSQIEERQRQYEASTVRLGEMKQELEEEQTRAEQLALETGAQKDTIEEHNSALLELREAISKSDQHCAGLRNTLAELNSRRRTIAELAEQAGQEEGAIALLQDEELGSSLARVTSITFTNELRPAFTRLLAHMDDALVGQPDSRSRAASILSGAGADSLLLTGSYSGEFHEQSLWRQLSGDRRVINALAAMLGDVLLANDPQEADGLLAGNSGVSAVVLRDGSMLIGRSHSFIGQPSPEKALKVARQSDLAYLDEQIEDIRLRLDKASAELNELRRAQQKRQQERDDAVAKLAAAEERLRNALQLCDRLHSSIGERSAELQLQASQTKQLEADRGKLQEERPEREKELRELREQQSQIQQRGNELEQQRKAAELELDEARRLHTEALTRKELADQQVRHLEKEEQDSIARAQSLRSRMQQLGSRIESSEKERQLALQTSGSAAEQATLLEEQLGNSGTELETLAKQREQLELQGRELQEQLASLGQARNKLEQEQVSLSGQRERALERITEWLAMLEERHQLTLTQLMNDASLRVSPVEADMDAAEAGRNKLRAEKARLQELLDRIGTVNLLSIEQHQEHSRRLDFLDSQAIELEKAVADLGKLVADLDRTTEVRYRRSLRRIEKRFNDIFLVLFGSGFARLKYDEPEDIINSGVEVEVQLPGSRRHSLRSLSGGQRTLIFLALFFAVHGVRSPGFCVLDEADAALDDANVERFAKLIKHYSEDEQFIVVTHNKKTMECADKLVGVVGRPRGVSNLLDVNMRDARKMVDQAAGA
ncbi:MAG: AAA family ATPase [Planctomycetales bacterium]|nr:AAA family ATPase [bacterium]UNM09258.1 MAG: AAA family ATPase [Planctomycetales bacterium]